MESIDRINEVNFLEAAQNITPDSGADVYFYALSNEGIHLRKTLVNDFNTWAMVHNHYTDNTSLIIVGAPPVNNASRYTLIQHLQNVVVPEPVVADEPAAVEES
jgi:hypothetical protein